MRFKICLFSWSSFWLHQTSNWERCSGLGKEGSGGEVLLDGFIGFIVLLTGKCKVEADFWFFVFGWSFLLWSSLFDDEYRYRLLWYYYNKNDQKKIRRQRFWIKKIVQNKHRSLSKTQNKEEMAQANLIVNNWRSSREWGAIHQWSWMVMVAWREPQHIMGQQMAYVFNYGESGLLHC